MTSPHGHKARREIIDRIRKVAIEHGARVVAVDKTGRGRNAITIEIPGGQGSGQATGYRRRLVVGASSDWRALRNAERDARAMLRSMGAGN